LKLDIDQRESLDIRVNLRNWYHYIGFSDAELREAELHGKKGKQEGDYGDIALLKDQRLKLFEELKKSAFMNDVSITMDGEVIRGWIVPFFQAMFTLITGTRSYGSFNAIIKPDSQDPNKRNRASDLGIKPSFEEVPYIPPEWKIKDAQGERPFMRTFTLIDKGNLTWQKKIFPELETVLRKYVTWREAYAMKHGAARNRENYLYPFGRRQYHDMVYEIKLAGERAGIFSYAKNADGSLKTYTVYEKKSFFEAEKGNYHILPPSDPRYTYRTKLSKRGIIITATVAIEHPIVVSNSTGVYFEMRPVHAMRHTSAQMFLELLDWDYDAVATLLGWKGTDILKGWYGKYPAGVLSKWDQKCFNVSLNTDSAMDKAGAVYVDLAKQKAETERVLTQEEVIARQGIGKVEGDDGDDNDEDEVTNEPIE